jgi:hypothetical protein
MRNVTPLRWIEEAEAREIGLLALEAVPVSSPMAATAPTERTASAPASLGKGSPIRRSTSLRHAHQNEEDYLDEAMREPPRCWCVIREPVSGAKRDAFLERDRIDR